MIYKLVLVLSGLLILAIISNSFYSCFILLGVALLTYGIAYCQRYKHICRYSNLIASSAVPIAFIIIIIFNLLGLIGTLTGSSHSEEYSYRLMLAAPFYFLSSAAFISDIYSKKLLLPNLFDYITYLTLPFKLLAGPLEAPRLLIQIKNLSMRFTWWRFSAAWPWIALGLFMKFVIANRLSPALNIQLIDAISVLINATIFEIKFYFDFAGYSFIAYGTALACGFKINQNFHHPFFSSNVVIFWRRWHMSLGRFLSQYILEPNLKVFSKRQEKIIFASSIFIVSGMWHGGTYNYLTWGVFHGLCYLLYVQFIKRKYIPKFIGIAAMILFLILGRLIAIDSDWARLIQKVSKLLAIPFEGHNLSQTSILLYKISSTELYGIIAAVIFLIIEAINIRVYPDRSGYHLFRRPISAFFLLIIFLIFGINSGSLLYARI